MMILIADPNPEVQSALQLIVERLPSVTRVNKASSPVQLMAQCAQSCPRLILLEPDILQPSRARIQNLADLVFVLRRICPDSEIVIMSSRFEALQEAQAAGIDAFISKTDPPDAVRSGIVRIMENCSSK